jgi:putative peptidoglycan lipid II flippase
VSAAVEPHAPVDEERVGGASIATASWTLISRVTGFARAVVVAAVLGATYLGNTYQAVNLLPNLAFELLTGSLFASLLVPRLVRRLDLAERRSAEQLAGGFLGVVMIGALVVTVVTVLAGELVMRVLSLGVDTSAVAEDQRRVGWLLLVLLMPQLVLYTIAGTGSAVMNAHGRFALAAAAPALENLGIIATLTATAIIFGAGASLGDVGTPELLFLGLGTTGSVALHASVQWWGARRCGTVLVPRAGWREPEVREIVRLMAPTFGYSSLNALCWCAAIVVANSVPGGVVAFILAMNFLNLPIAVGSRPVATAFLPTLSRLFNAGALGSFRDEFVRALGLALFITVPAAVSYLVLATPLAKAVAVGEMATPHGVHLLTLSLAAVAVGVVGEAAFVVSTYASYAQRDARAPWRCMVSRTAVTLTVIACASVWAKGDTVVLALGIAISAGNAVGAWQLIRRVRSTLPAGGQSLAPPLLRTGLASVIMAGPAYLIAVWVEGFSTPAVGLAVAGVVAAIIFAVVQRRLHSPELAFFLGGLRSVRRWRAA